MLDVEEIGESASIVVRLLAWQVCTLVQVLVLNNSTVFVLFPKLESAKCVSNYVAWDSVMHWARLQLLLKHLFRDHGCSITALLSASSATDAAGVFIPELSGLEILYRHGQAELPQYCCVRLHAAFKALEVRVEFGPLLDGAGPVIFKSRFKLVLLAVLKHVLGLLVVINLLDCPRARLVPLEALGEDELEVFELNRHLLLLLAVHFEK